MGKILTVIAAAFLLLAAYSCNTAGCTDNQNSLPLAGFYTTDNLGNSQAIKINALEIGGVGAPGDSLLYTSNQQLEKVYLPLRSTVNSTSFFIHYTQPELSDPSLNDTITFGYTSTPYFASEECGAVYYYHINHMTHTTHLIDSVVVTDSLITNSDVERIRIYFRTTTTQE